MPDAQAPLQVGRPGWLRAAQMGTHTPADSPVHVRAPTRVRTCTGTPTPHTHAHTPHTSFFEGPATATLTVGPQGPLPALLCPTLEVGKGTAGVSGAAPRAGAAAGTSSDDAEWAHTPRVGLVTAGCRGALGQCRGEGRQPDPWGLWEDSTQPSELNMGTPSFSGTQGVPSAPGGCSWDRMSWNLSPSSHFTLLIPHSSASSPLYS